MLTQVELDDIVEAFEFMSMEVSSFVNVKTGEVVHVLNDYLGMAEEGEPCGDLSEWEQDVMILALQIIEQEDNFIRIDSQYIDEYKMMEEFCYAITDPVKQEDLLYAITGKGAFRRFKDLVFRFGLIDQWYEYRDIGYKNSAKNFCHKHNVNYV